MNTISIVAQDPALPGSGFLAIAGDKQSTGKTAGQALDGITSQLPENDVLTLVVVQSHRPDRFFTSQQIARLQELMSQWRQARDAKKAMPAADQAELEALVDAETRATRRRKRHACRFF